jgi:hypothetical protein
MRTVTHIAAGRSEIVDCRKLIEAAESLDAMVRSL